MEKSENTVWVCDLDGTLADISHRVHAWLGKRRGRNFSLQSIRTSR